MSRIRCTLTTLAPKPNLPGVLLESSAVSTAPGKHAVPLSEQNTRSASLAPVGSLSKRLQCCRLVRCFRLLSGMIQGKWLQWEGLNIKMFVQAASQHSLTLELEFRGGSTASKTQHVLQVITHRSYCRVHCRVLTRSIIKHVHSCDSCVYLGCAGRGRCSTSAVSSV